MILRRSAWFSLFVMFLFVTSAVRAQDTPTVEPPIPTAVSTEIPPTEAPPPTASPTATDLPTAIPTDTFTPEPLPTETETPTSTATDTPTDAAMPSESATETPTATASEILTATASQTLTATPSLTPSATQAQAVASPFVQAALITCNPSSSMIDASVDSNGVQGNNGSAEPSISLDGRYIVYVSAADNLVSGDTNGQLDIFRYDRITCQTVRASVAADGTQSNNSSRVPSISPNGRYVAFMSSATNLTSGDNDTLWDYYIKDLQTGSVTRLQSGAPSGGGLGFAYFGDDNNFVFANPTNLSLYNLQTQQLSILVTSSSPDIGRKPMSSDLRYVVFGSGASNLVTGDTNNVRDVFLLDRQTSIVTRISVSSASTQGNNESNQPSISANGRYVEFVSAASNLVVGDTNNHYDTFVRDLQTGDTIRISVSTTGIQGNNDSVDGSISDDGRYIAFESIATNLDGSSVNGANIYVRDLMTNQTYLISRNPDGSAANKANDTPAMSSNGDFIVFSSYAETVIAGDANLANDVFIAVRSAFAPPIDEVATQTAAAIATNTAGTSTALANATNVAGTATAGAPQTATAAASDPNNLIVNSFNDNLDGTCDANNCTLRDAIEVSNISGNGVQTIRFFITGTGVHTIPLKSPLTITSSVIIDGTTQPGYNGTPLIELIPYSVASMGDRSAIDINGAALGTYDPNTSVTIRGLAINSFGGTAINVANGQGHLIEKNYIGTDASGKIAKGNNKGITFLAPNSIIRDNLISSNTIDGIYMLSSSERNSTNNVVTGNFIGTDVTGALKLPNQRGIHLTNGAANNTIGGTAAGTANVISGNTAEGILIDTDTTSGNRIIGNLIGLDASSQYLLGNGSTGISVSSATNTTIGGATAAEGNDIWGNGLEGIKLANSAANTTVRNNFIGQNGIQAITVTTGATNTIIAENTIAHNTSKGIEVSASTRARISSNRMNDNGSIGIDLGSNGLTPNDLGDVDTGANNLQNFPVVTSAINSALNATLTGTLNSQPNQTYHLEFFSNSTCASSGYGEGETILGYTNVSTDGSGNASFSTQVPVITGASPVFITSTATDANGNTSEFSACRLVQNVLGVGSYQESDTNLTYSGNWVKFTGNGPKAGSVKYTNDPNSKVNFWVNDTVGRIVLYRTTYSNYGSTQIYLDDGASPIATINNTTPTLIYGQSYTLNISPGYHKVELRNVGTKYSSVDQIDLLPAAAALSVGTYQETDVNLSYSGVWVNNSTPSAFSGARLFTTTLNSSVSFSINNTVGRVTIYRTTGPTASYGSMQVFVDGSLTPLTTINNVNPTLLYRQPFTFVVTPGDHVITLKNVVAKSSDIDQITLLAPALPFNQGVYQETESEFVFLGNWRTSATGLGGSRIITNDPNGSLTFTIDSSVGLVTLYRTIGLANMGYGSMRIYLDGSTTPMTTISNVSTTLLYGQPFAFAVIPGNHLVTIKNVGATTSDIDQISLMPALTSLTVGTYQENNINLIYNGKWVNNTTGSPLGGYRIYTKDPNGSVSFTIDNTVGRVTLYRTVGTAAAGYGSMQVFLDNSGTPLATINDVNTVLLYGQPFTFEVTPGAHIVTLKNVGVTSGDLDQITLLPPAIPLAAAVDPYQETNSNLTFLGNWRMVTNAAAFGGTRMFTNDPNGSMRFSVDNSVGLVTLYRATGPAPTYGTTQILVDGNLTATISNVSATLLYGQPFTFAVIPGSHVITFKNVGTTSSDVDQIALLPPTTVLSTAQTSYQENEPPFIYNGNWINSTIGSPLGGARVYTKDPNGRVSFAIDNSVGRVTLYRTTGTAAAGYGSMQVFLDGGAAPFATISNVSPTLLYGQPFTFAVISGDHIVTLKNVGTTSSDLDQVTVQAAASLSVGSYPETQSNLIYNGNWVSNTNPLALDGARIYTKDPNGSVTFAIDNSVGRVTLYRTVGMAAAGYGSMQVFLDNSPTPLTTISNINPTLLYQQPFTFNVTPGDHIITFKNVATTSSDIDEITLLPPPIPLITAANPYQETDSNLTYSGNWRTVANAAALGGTRIYTNDPNGSVSFKIDSSVGRVTIYHTTNTAAAGYGSMKVYLDGSATPLATISNVSTALYYGQTYSFTVTHGDHIITIKNVGTKISDIDQIVLAAS